MRDSTRLSDGLLEEREQEGEVERDADLVRRLLAGEQRLADRQRLLKLEADRREDAGGA